MVKLSPSTSTPTAAVPKGIKTIKTAACEAGTERTPVIHSQTVTMLAVIEPLKKAGIDAGWVWPKEGAIGSNQVKRGDLSVIDDWAGRGGLGSRLLQHHRVAAIIFGGDWQDPALKQARLERLRARMTAV